MEIWTNRVGLSDCYQNVSTLIYYDLDLNPWTAILWQDVAGPKYPCVYNCGTFRVQFLMTPVSMAKLMRAFSAYWFVWCWSCYPRILPIKSMYCKLYCIAYFFAIIGLLGIITIVYVFQCSFVSLLAKHVCTKVLCYSVSSNYHTVLACRILISGMCWISCSGSIKWHLALVLYWLSQLNTGINHMKWDSWSSYVYEYHCRNTIEAGHLIL
jgi:hypothetical protein